MFKILLLIGAGSIILGAARYIFKDIAEQRRANRYVCPHCSQPVEDGQWLCRVCHTDLEENQRVDTWA